MWSLEIEHREVSTPYVRSSLGDDVTWLAVVDVLRFQLLGQNLETTSQFIIAPSTTFSWQDSKVFFFSMPSSLLSFTPDSTRGKIRSAQKTHTCLCLKSKTDSRDTTNIQSSRCYVCCYEDFRSTGFEVIQGLLTVNLFPNEENEVVWFLTKSVMYSARMTLQYISQSIPKEGDWGPIWTNCNIYQTCLHGYTARLQLLPTWSHWQCHPL